MLNIRNLSTQSLWRVLIVFFFFSLADLFLTWQLIERDTFDVIESNPLAAIVLTSYGWFGLAGYKLALVMTFFGLALAIERRRPIGGLLLLVFACGVHAAVVTSSAFLYLEHSRTDAGVEAFSADVKQQRQRLPVGGLALLNQKPVQEELKLTNAQIREVVHVTKKRRELSREINHAHLDSCQSKLMLVSVLEHNLVSELTPAQVNRLGQLTLQKRGLFALQDVNIMCALELSEHQRNAVLSLVEQVQLPPTPPRGRQPENGLLHETDAPANEMKANLLSFLTDVQKTHWNAMQGVPFCFRSGKSIPVTAEATE